jgi:acetate kinase
MRILVVNAGSSSVKLRMREDDDGGEGGRAVGSVDLTADRGRFDDAELAAALDRLGRSGRGGPPDAVGHRVVHGGPDFTGPTLLDDGAVDRIEALSDLAPLHNPAAVTAIRAVTAALPDVPAVACFDTSFHADLPAAAATYPLPAAWRERWPIRRYGFHGLSHASAYRTAVARTGLDPATARVVTCHLGSGASLAAVHGGRSVDTTMGFTPMEGVVMATRSGTVDPGLILWLIQHGGLSPDEVFDGLDRESGLMGLAGTTNMKEILEKDLHHPALDVYDHRLRAGIAAMTAALGGLDVLVFTGGIGENAAPVRARAAAGLGFLGVSVDEAANATARPDAEVTAAGAVVRTLVLVAREDAEIAGQVRGVLGGGSGDAALR